MSLGTHKIVEDNFSCTHCHDRRFVVPLVDGQPQRAVACSCFARALDQQALRSQRQLPIRLQAMTFEACSWRHERNEQAFNRCREFAWEPEGWLLLTGGERRTYLAAAIANVRLQQGLAVQVVTTADFLDTLRSTFDTGGYDTTFRAIRACSLLVLLDLGYENSSGWSLEKLYQLLHHRLYNDLPLVLTTPHAVAKLNPRVLRLFNQHPDLGTLIV